MNVSGLSIQDIMDMSWSSLQKMSLQELKQISTRLNSAANKRVRRLNASKVKDYSPALRAVNESGGSFTTKGKSTKIEIINEIHRAENFLGSKTGTVGGASRYKKTIEKLFKTKKKKAPKVKSEKEDTKVKAPAKGKTPTKKKEKPITEAQKKKLFRALDRLRETSAVKVYNVGSPETIKEIRKIQEEDGRTSVENLVKRMEEKFPELLEDAETTYVKQQQEYINREDADGVFRPLMPDESIPDAFRQ